MIMFPEQTSTSPIDFTGAMFRDSPSPPQQQRSREGDTCFKCKKQGHWAIDCPTKTPEKSKISASSSSSPVPVILGPDGLQYSPPSLLCRCGVRCTIRTSRTTKNPSRKFYSCPDNLCDYFKWEDEVNREELVNVPKCGCEAGFCRQSIDTSGTNAGRKYFACPIKKGQGACAYVKLLDCELMTSNDHEDETFSPHQPILNPAKNVEGGIFGHEGVEVGSDTMDTTQYSQNHGAVSIQLEGQASNGTLKIHDKRLRHGAPQYDGSSLNTIGECIDMPRSFSGGRAPSVTEVEIHLRQVEFLRHISIEGVALAVSSAASYSCSYPSNLWPLREDRLVTAAKELNVDHFKGWWGRVAYPPSRTLTLPAPKPFFCCVFPSFDRIFVPQIVDKFDQQPSSLRSVPGTVHGSIMIGAISEAFAKLAGELQNQLLALLELTDCNKHNAMDREARNTFAALDQLKIGYQPFRERVEEFIKRASFLAEIEGSICSDQSHELRERYNCKKRRFNDISHYYNEAKANLDTSRERLQSLNEEASRVRDMLFQVESELSCCVAENQCNETRFVQMSKALKESEQDYQVAFEAAEEALKLYQQRKEERNAAEAAFKKARVRLRLII